MIELDKHEVRIHIDQKTYHSSSPTTGADLYELGSVKDGNVLYKEVEGDEEDKLIPIDDQHVHLSEDEHFHSADTPDHYYTIIVNTDPVVVHHDVLTFDQLVKIAFPVAPTGLDPEFTVSFEHAESKPHAGDLVEGGTVTVKKHGTIFDVAHTNRS
jgi:hypothetical protein